jgi:thiol:disulfide interchange protein DsbG
MHSRMFSLFAIAALSFTLLACSRQDAQPVTSIAPAQAYESVAGKARGFAVGALMSTNTVYVLFDPQCPHCGHLWQQAQPLMKKVKFVWVPVAFINAKSAPQGAALLGAANPAELMATHEASILAGTGGIGASSSVPSDTESAIQANTALLNSLGADSVPFIVAKSLRNGQTVTNTGAMETAALASFLGLDAQ